MAADRAVAEIAEDRGARRLSQVRFTTTKALS
jgi:hypothetical protein